MEKVKSNARMIENNSGCGAASRPLDIVKKKFNWGAFLWGWLWALRYGKWSMFSLPILFCFISLTIQTSYIVLMVSQGLTSEITALFPQIVALVNSIHSWEDFADTSKYTFLIESPAFLIIAISNLVCIFALICLQLWFGASGNEWAWKAVKYKNIPNFHRSQKAWVQWYFTFILAILSLGVGIYFFIQEGLPIVKEFTSGFGLKMGFSNAYITLDKAAMSVAKEMQNNPSKFSSQEAFVNSFAKHIQVKDINSSGFTAVDGTMYAFQILNYTCGPIDKDVKKACIAIKIDVNGSTPPNTSATVDELGDRFTLYFFNNGISASLGSAEEAIKKQVEQFIKK